VLVVGSGIAGSATALSAANRGLQVTVLSSAAELNDCNSQWAQGGIIYKGVQDTPEALSQDIHVAGAGRCSDRAVKIVSEEGPGAVETLLLENGAQFDKSPDGSLALCLEGGHGQHRIVHWGDRTGAEIIRCLHAELLAHPRIQAVPSLMAHELIVDGDGCQGLYAVDAQGRGVTIAAGETVLATGGIGEIYGRSSNPKSARGDGIGMAIRAGVETADMEYVQFHPTTLARGASNFLISEAVRGEGGRLVNALGEYFASDYDLRGDLAPRDIVARMIFRETARTGCAYLDVRHLGSEFLQMRFPSIFDYCMSQGLDMGKDLLPVTPAEHFICGGVTSDEHAQTSVPYLRAVGEAACSGLHGANRLASTSLLEGLVYGQRAALAISGRAPVLPVGRQEPAPTQVAEVPQLWERLQDTMWTNVGLMRSADKLGQAEADLQALVAENEAACASAATRSTGVLSFRNALATAGAIARAAAANTASVGTHYREDEPGAAKVVYETFGQEAGLKQTA
jgi:L-aspartate oxidase